MALPQVVNWATPRVNAASTTYAVDNVASPVEGNLLICHLRVNHASTSITDLQGFEITLSHQVAGANSSFVLAKVAGASEAATYNFVGTASGGSVGTVIQVSGQHPTLASATGSKAGTPFTTAATEWIIPSITTEGDDRLVLWLVSANATTNFTFGRGTEMYDSLNTNRSIAGAREDRATAGATGTCTVTLSASGTGAGQVIAIAPAPPSGQSATLRPDAIITQTNDTRTLTDLQRDVA